MTDDMTAFAQKHQIIWTRAAITDRSGADTSPMTLRIERTSWDRLPPIGAQVKASGRDGWTYWGIVDSHDADGVHYTVRVTVAANKRLDNARLWNGMAPEQSRQD